ncbi:Nicotinamidase-related amidase [Ferrimonas sediminum]|uniref:Nicotinamidase-related amidase n=1 Tax=Ferrimonas sediminum TaxID=718193 RepID=A0A1G8SFT7_9GAMM|nr:cysteine hydrolase family protein [Ferrimonas sediminum]SDJ28024.1 Nicotinamidase-related amidase [Ferrimonas sediminum]
MANTAVIVIDLQNDYFPGGAYPQWQAQQVTERTLGLIERARQQGMPVVLVQHLADVSAGLAPFFNPGTPGAKIHDSVLQAAEDAEVVVKGFADGFEGTNLDEVLQRLGVERILLCGMMTQNCVTHTALSKAAERYRPVVLADCTSSVDERIHQIALNALSIRVPVLSTERALA